MAFKSVLWCFLNSTNSSRVLNAEFWTSRHAKVWWLQIEISVWLISVYLCHLKTELWVKGWEKAVTIKYRRIKVWYPKHPKYKPVVYQTWTQITIDEKQNWFDCFINPNLCLFLPLIFWWRSVEWMSELQMFKNTTQTITNINIIGQSYKEWKINLSEGKSRGEKQGREEGEGEGEDQGK